MTWLYGPLQKCSDTSSRPVTLGTSSRVSKSVNKRPILKKRRASEIMLQRSLFSSSLVKRAAAAVQSQISFGFDRPYLGLPDIAPMALVSSQLSGHYPSLVPSASSSSSQSAGPLDREMKHIHFNEQVEQCVALGMRRADGAAINDSRTIAVLPPTTLKYGDCIPELHRSRLCPSPARESRRLSESVGVIHSDSEEGDNIDWLPQSFQGHKTSKIANQERSQNSLVASPFSPNEEHSRTRTLSEMVVQYDEDEDDRAFGLFGRTVDTLNTAKDIAYIIWNVGGGSGAE